MICKSQKKFYLVITVFIASILYCCFELYGKVQQQKITIDSLLATMHEKATPRLFEEFGLSNLKMLKPLEMPRKLFEFVMEPQSIKAETPEKLLGKEIKLTMLVAVKSHHKRVEHRNKIRESWGAIRSLDGIRMEVIFTIALPETVEVQSTLKNENKKFGDLLQVRMNETYSEIGLKALASMQWISDHFPSNYLYFSGDDDIIPNFKTLLTVINKLMVQANQTGNFEQKLPIICAYRYRYNTPALRGGTWGVSKDDYPHSVYPPMCYGGFYGMSVKLAKSIYNASRYYPYFRMDDVFITAFLRLKVCDTFQDEEFQFDNTKATCAISPLKSEGFLHTEASISQFIETWMTRENRLVDDGSEIVKFPRSQINNDN